MQTALFVPGNWIGWAAKPQEFNPSDVLGVSKLIRMAHNPFNGQPLENIKHP